MGKLIDLSNQRFGFWLVLKRGSKSSSGHTQWICQCECGVKKEVTSNSLRTGNSTSCGCNHTPNLINRVVGKLTVLSLDDSKNNGIRRFWKCKCDCGNIISVNTHRLRENLINSCGCDLFKKNVIKRKENTLKNIKVLEEESQFMEIYNKELQKSLELLKKIREFQ